MYKTDDYDVNSEKMVFLRVKSGCLIYNLAKSMKKGAINVSVTVRSPATRVRFIGVTAPHGIHAGGTETLWNTALAFYCTRLMWLNLFNAENK